MIILIINIVKSRGVTLEKVLSIEFERANLKERQAEGIAIAKEKGRFKGRKKIELPSEWVGVYNQYKNRAITGTSAMDQLGLKRNTFYNLIREYEKG